ncbi:MAG TPA: hypothetical protein VLC95_00755 [Anaerolineae bacterium]|nr:hypothetical protein [Anaerolineae bacterium]
MIPVEYLWIALIIVFGFVGSARGLNRELGVTTILLLSLFVLKFGWERVGERITGAVGSRLSADMVEAFFYIIVIAFVAFISYEGVSLSFPVRQQRGVAKGTFGLPGGLLNGYLIIGTIWDVLNQARYLGLQVPYGSSGTTIAIADHLTQLHNAIAPYLPITFINEFVFLILGMILLLAIVLK